ncbi:hypothetical protein Tco_0509312 [Tanacetum coccineum]
MYNLSVITNLSSYGSDVLSEVPFFENTNNDMLNQSVQEMTYYEPSQFVKHPDEEIHSDSNIIMYLVYLSETQNVAVNKDNLIANESLSAELERYKERVKLLEERKNMDLSTREKLIVDDFEKEINSLKQTLSEQLKEKESLTKTFNVFKNESREKEAKNVDNKIALEKKKAQQIRPMLYDGNVIAKETDVISITASEENLMLEEESRSKMLLKQNFGKRFVPQQELSDKQALHLAIDQSASSHVKIEAFGNFLSIKNDLRKLKGKDIVDNAAKISNVATIAPGIYKLDLVILAPKVKNNREAHEYYLKHTMEQAAILREVVEQAKS